MAPGGDRSLLGPGNPANRPSARRSPAGPAARLLAIALAGLALTTALGYWQTRRAEAKLQAQARWDAAAQRAPIEVTAATLAAPAQQLPSRIRTTGSFDFDATIWLGNRFVDGQPGWIVVTPLVLGDGKAVLVARGWIGNDPGGPERLPRLGRPAPPVSIEGIAVDRVPRVFELGPTVPDPRRPAVWQNLDPGEFQRLTGRPVASWMVEQTSDTGDGLRRQWDPPRLGVDRNRGYAIQWYGMAAVFALLAIVQAVRLFRGGAFAAARRARSR
jgi:cytochrome oxidase assembly protein ShyY1